MSDPQANSKHRQTRIEFIAAGARAFVGLIAGAGILNGCADRGSRPADDLDDLRKTDPATVGYRETARFGTGFTQARGVAAAPDGSLYVAGDNSIRMFSRAGALSREVALDGAPECMALDPDGTLFVGLSDRVEVRPVGGGAALSWPPLGGKTLITSIAVGRESVWVADAGSRRAVRLSRTGESTLSLGERNTESGYPGLNVPSPHMDVAVGLDGTVYVGNPGEHRVEAWSADGKLKSTWGGYGTDISRFCGCCNPTDFALMPDGRFVTSEKGLPRVKVYSASGKFDCVVAGADTFAEDTAGIDIAVDREGNVVLLDPKHAEVRLYAPAQGAKA